MSHQGFFITGTDTGVGKTLISCAIIHHLKQQGRRVQGMKPIAAGADNTAEGLRNEDALQLIEAAQSELAYDVINPYCYAEATAPHIAAEKTHRPIDSQKILSCYQMLCDSADVVIVEGAGGWLVPINNEQTLADLAIALQLPVILVVGIRLGCLNHALLTQEAIKASGLSLAGWVANVIEPDNPRIEENIDYLRRAIQVPLLATVPFQSQACAKRLANELDFSQLELL